MVPVACPLCGAPHAACGQATTSVGITITPAPDRKDTDMSLKAYEAEVNGTRTTLLLSEADAKARGLTEKKAKAPANKAATPPANKGS